MYQDILYEVADPVATISLNRPDRLNAWTGRMGDELRHAVAQAEADSSVVAIVITGSGRGFCAGADMESLKNLSEGGDAGGILAAPRRRVPGGEVLEVRRDHGRGVTGAAGKRCQQQ